MNRRSFTITTITIILARTFVVFIGRSRNIGVFNQLLSVSSAIHHKSANWKWPEVRDRTARIYVGIGIYTCTHICSFNVFVFVICPRFNFAAFPVRSANQNVYVCKRSNISPTSKCEQAWGYWILRAKRRLIETTDRTATNTYSGRPGEEKTIFILYTLQAT